MQLMGTVAPEAIALFAGHEVTSIVAVAVAVAVVVVVVVVVVVEEEEVVVVMVVMVAVTVVEEVRGVVGVDDVEVAAVVMSTHKRFVAQFGDTTCVCVPVQSAPVCPRHKDDPRTKNTDVAVAVTTKPLFCEMPDGTEPDWAMGWNDAPRLLDTNSEEAPKTYAVRFTLTPRPYEKFHGGVYDEKFRPASVERRTL